MANNENIYRLFSEIQTAVEKYNNEEIKSGRRHQATSCNDTIEHMYYVKDKIANCDNSAEVLDELQRLATEYLYGLIEVL